MKKVPYPAPDFSLISSDDVRVSLKDFHGSWLVLYFYPQDATPGCTAEACSFRDMRDELVKAGAHVVGISQNTPAEHEAFKAKFSLNFILLSDPRAEVHQRYGAWRRTMLGETPKRMTFLIDPEGIVRKVYARVNPFGHGTTVLDDLKKLAR